MTADQAARKVLRQLCLDYPEAAQAHRRDVVDAEVWDAARLEKWTGYGSKQDRAAVCWEEGPYEWAISKCARYSELLEGTGWYCEPWNGFILTVYPTP